MIGGGFGSVMASWPDRHQYHADAIPKPKPASANMTATPLTNVIAGDPPFQGNVHARDCRRQHRHAGDARLSARQLIAPSHYLRRCPISPFLLVRIDSLDDPIEPGAG